MSHVFRRVSWTTSSSKRYTTLKPKKPSSGGLIRMKFRWHREVHFRSSRIDWSALWLYDNVNSDCIAISFRFFDPSMPCMGYILFPCYSIKYQPNRCFRCFTSPLCVGFLAKFLTTSTPTAVLFSFTSDKLVPWLMFLIWLLFYSILQCATDMGRWLTYVLSLLCSFKFPFLDLCSPYGPVWFVLF